MRLINADVLKRICQDYNDSLSPEIIDYIPTVDAVPVVRCRDCKYSEDLDGNLEKIYIDGCMRCARQRGDALNVVAPDEYCSEGEREDEAK